MNQSKWVYDFAEGSREMRELLGGKGANVAEMTRVLGSDQVPPGFTITTEASVAFMRDGSEPDGLAEQVAAALERLQDLAGKRFGDDSDPLLVSVRSGARESMPGMLDTVLNLGLNDTSVGGLAQATDNEHFAWDSYRRLVQMFGNVAYGIEGSRFEDALRQARTDSGVETDPELPVAALKELVEQFQGFYEFPQDPQEQLRQAIRAVFNSWSGTRAVDYRRINRIPDDVGDGGQRPADGVRQQGRRPRRLGSHSAATRSPARPSRPGTSSSTPRARTSSPACAPRTTSPSSPRRCPTPTASCSRSSARSSRTTRTCRTPSSPSRRGICGCSRRATRSGPRRLRCGSPSTRWTRACSRARRRIATIDPASLDALLHPTFDREAGYTVLAQGVAASPGAAVGEIVFSAPEAVQAAKDGRDVILVRPFTEADDVAGFHAARGILTSEGGKASHAALVARGMGVPAVTGAPIEIHLDSGEVRIDGSVFHAGDLIAIDGSEGAVVEPGAELVEGSIDEYFKQVLAWSDEIRRLGVRANADTPHDAAQARELGAEGIGLCRTEHMFMAEDRQPKMRAMIMAEDGDGRRAALAELLPLQQQDFEGIFDVMQGLPVTIRLLDPPLHEFLPNLPELRAQVERARIELTDDLDELEELLTRVEEIHEGNPMLGTRGCRLGILYPEIYEMQVHAIMRAARAVDRAPHPEIMIPLVAYEQELEILRALVVRVGAEHGMHEGSDYTVGTMIELPRACFVADRIARHADFFSFGTNDLTQTAIGLSRDDAESKFVPTYIADKIIDRSPFETIDAPGVGWLVRLAAWVGREAHPGLKLGVCGEHGGEPDSIRFFDRAGLDYVSCSPYRVPIARVAAARSTIAAQAEEQAEEQAE